MSQKESARRIAIVRMSALPIMLFFPVHWTATPSKRDTSSFECLVLAKIGDRQPKRVDGDELVGNLVLENEDEIRCVKVALDFAMVGGRVVHHVKIHSRLVWRGLHVFECNLLHMYVDLRRGRVRQKLSDNVVLPVRVEDAIGQLPV